MKNLADVPIKRTNQIKLSDLIKISQVNAEDFIRKKIIDYCSPKAIKLHFPSPYTCTSRTHWRAKEKKTKQKITQKAKKNLLELASWFTAQRRTPQDGVSRMILTMKQIIPLSHYVFYVCMDALLVSIIVHTTLANAWLEPYGRMTKGISR